jgi:hypothetical protein
LRVNLVILLVILLPAFLLGACAVPAATLEPLNLSTRTQTSTTTSTMTIQWFPSTNTPTPRATHTIIPTVDRRPGVVDVLLEDDFLDAASWVTLQSQTGNIALGNHQLTLAVVSPGGDLFSLRDTPVVNNFYLEINAATSLCKNTDSYGLILRAGEDGTYYRYAVTCSGLLSLEEVRNNRTSVIHDWSPSGQLRPGAPARVRLGVWAYGDEMRLFAGDVYQFSVQNLEFSEGRVGVFARSEGETALTVSFSDLLIYSLGRVPPTLTPTPTPLEVTATPAP